MLDEIRALSKPVTSNSVSTPQESKGVNNDKVIAPGMFRINRFKTSREEKNVPNTVRASNRTKPITVSQPPIFIKKDVHSNSNGLSSIGVDNTTKTKRTQPRSSSKKNKVPYVVKSSYKKNKEADEEEKHMNLLSSSNKKYVSSKHNNVKLSTQNVYSKVVCAMCKQCLISVNHDVCLLNYVNGINSRRKKQNANVSNVADQKKHKAQLWKPKNVGSKERLALPKPSSPRSCLRWSLTGRFFDLKGKIIESSESESQSDCSSGDYACSSNPLESISKRFPNLTFSMIGSDDGVTTSFQLSQTSRPPCSIIKDKFMMKAQKYIFSANHDSCFIKFPNKVNSRAKVPSNKTVKRNKPVEQISVPNKQERHIPTRHRFSIKKTSIVQKKTMSPRSCLRWKQTDRTFKTVGLRWVPTGKIFASSTTKVDSKPLNGLNADITNQYECEHNLDVSAGTLNLSAGTSFNPKKEGLEVWLLKR
nr:hypothetical protein [Tanacetum cinerariifolium]